MATIKFITEPLQQYVTRTKTKDMVYARTTYTCPLCKVSVSNREFLKHVNTTHALRKDECFAMLYGVPFPTRKDTRFLKRLSMAIRTYAVNCEKEKLQELANVIDAKVASL